MSFTVYQAIAETWSNGGPVGLWYRIGAGELCPAKGESVALWEGGMRNDVKQRHFDHELRPCADLRQIVVDPKDAPQGAASVWYDYNTTWFSDQEGGGLDYLIDKLETAGWLKWGDE